MGNICFGVVNVKGRSRVPSPPTRMTACTSYFLAVVGVDGTDVIDVPVVGVEVDVFAALAFNIAWIVVVDGLMACTPLGRNDTVISEFPVKCWAVGSVVVCADAVAKFVQYEIKIVPFFPASGVPAGQTSPFATFTAGADPLAGSFRAFEVIVNPG